MAVVISDEDFRFFHDTFETLTSPYSSEEELAECIRLENEIWQRLQAIKATLSGTDTNKWS